MLTGKNAIITGGVRGIGKAIAEEFCKNGANVMLCYRSNTSAAEKTAGELAQYGTKVELMQGDVADPEYAKEVTQKAKEVFGSIDILVNNAGITRDTLLMRMSEADWDMVMNVNVKSVFNHTKAIQPLMLKQRYGSIINLGSVVGVTGNAGQTNYSASKAAIIGFSKSIARELGSRNIRCNVIAPGFIETEMTHKLTPEIKEAYLKSISLRRAGKPKDVANVAVFLASELSDYVTGQVIICDGGM